MDRFSEMQVFARVVEDGGFSSAARSLSLTPSGVSKLIARLEDRLGVLLIKRNSRTMMLTAEGQTYYERVLTVLEAMDEAENSIANPAQETAGILRVYTNLGFAVHQLAPLMPEFNRRYPKLKVEVHTGTGPLRALDSNMDLALYPYDMEDCSLVCRRIAQTRWVICASPEYVATHGAPQRPADLAQHACLNFAMDVPCNTWKAWDSIDAKTVRVPANGPVAASESEMLLALARAGAGIIRVFEFECAEDLDAGRLVPLFPNDEDTWKQSIYAIYQSRRHLSQRARIFLEFLERKLTPYRESWRRTADQSPAKPALALVGA